MNNVSKKASIANITADSHEVLHRVVDRITNKSPMPGLLLVKKKELENVTKHGGDWKIITSKSRIWYDFFKV